MITQISLSYSVQQSLKQPFENIPGRRTYSPGIALFLSRVRLAEQLGGEHSYGYAMNNPVMQFDPDGNSIYRTSGPLLQSNAWIADKPNPAQKSCADVKKCLDQDKGWNCKSGHGCTTRHSVSKEKAICVMYHETRLLPDHGPNDNGGGLGQLTCGTIDDLTQSGCNRGACCVDDNKTGVTGKNWCAGAQAAYMWMQCRDIKYPGGYGDKTYTKEQLVRFTNCEKCLQAGKSCFNCLHQVLGPGQKP